MGQDNNGSHPIFILLILTIIAGSDGLKDVRLEGPTHVMAGDDATFNCHYNVEKDQLYAVKWYRGNKEFYRFVPKESPPTQVFPLDGIHVDIPRSNDHRVTLQSVSLGVSAWYKCVVSVENTFQTITDTKELIVVAAGYGGPSLTLDQDAFQGGETVRANCSVSKTSPPVNITWYLNDVEVRLDKARIKTYSFQDFNDTSVFTTTSLMTFDLPASFTTIRLKCSGNLFDVYSQSSFFDIHRTPPRGSHSSLSSSDSVLPSTSSASSFLGNFQEDLLHLINFGLLFLYGIELMRYRTTM